MKDLPLSCSCGQVRGIARGMSASTVNRMSCYCDDCQSFAVFLKKQGEVLDDWGGTDVTQVSPAQIEFTDGVEHIAILRLSPKGTLRWYASCCNTPIGNTPAKPSPPFVGLIHAFVDHDTHGEPRDVAVGPSRGGVQARFAFSAPPADKNASEKITPRQAAWAGWLMAKWWLSGHHRRPTAFFDENGQARAEATVLSLEERRAVEAERDDR